MDIRTFPVGFGMLLRIDVANLAGVAAQTFSVQKTLAANAVFRGAWIGAAPPFVDRGPKAFTSPSGNTIMASLAIGPTTVASANVGQSLGTLPATAPDASLNQGSPVGGLTVTFQLQDVASPTSATATSASVTAGALASKTLVLGSDNAGPFTVPLGTPSSLADVVTTINAATGGNPSAAVDGQDATRLIFTSADTGTSASLSFSGDAATALGLAASYSGTDGMENLSAVTAGHVEAVVLYDLLLLAERGER
jgi:hypothetical protein